MATLRYSTSITLCEDTAESFEFLDLLREADPGYSALNPVRTQIFVFDGTRYVAASTGFFTATDPDTFLVDMDSKPNFNGVLNVRIFGTDSSGNSLILDLAVNVTPANDAPSGSDETVVLGLAQTYVLGVPDFGYSDPVEGNAFLSVRISSLPTEGLLTLDGRPVFLDEEISVLDIQAGLLVYTAPSANGGQFGFDFQVRDDGGVEGCGANDLDLTPNTILFNVPQPASATLGDRVWEDLNANGVQDAGEQGLSGVTVRLKGTAGDVVATAVTDPQGNYQFTVAPGTYSVSVTAPAGYVATTQDQGGNEALDSDTDAAGNTAPVTLLAGANNPDLDAGYYRLAELGDRVWIDGNGNGQQDAGETGVQGVRVILLDANGVAVGAPAVTGADGQYLFAGLKPGTYSVQFDKTSLPAGYDFTAANIGNDAGDSDADVATGKTAATALISGESDLTWDAGLVAKPGSISGTVREDLDNNGSGDAPLAGVTVVLRDSGGAIVGTATTDANGNYSFNNVPAGSYTVQQTNLTDYLDVGDVDGGDPNRISVVLTAGQSSNGNDFVDERVATLGDRVWEDLNANGVQDAGEVGIHGVAVSLLDENGVIVGNAVTDANGLYNFVNLAPGNYAVQVQAPAGYLLSPGNRGADDGLDSDVDATGRSTLTTLMAGENDRSLDAGLYRTASLGDFVWFDMDRDGVQSNLEGGFLDITVKLLDASGTVVATTTTDAFGKYHFSNLTPGQYAVQVVAPNGYVFSGKALGGNDALDSDVDPLTGISGVTTLESGENDLSWDAGLQLRPVASIGDRVWEDANANGIQDAGEIGIQGVAVKLLDSTGTIVGNAVTNAFGTYQFTGLTPGSYSVRVETPAGYIASARDRGADDQLDSDIDATGNTVVTTLASGENDMSWDAGIYRKASIGDRVWLDSNQNGIQDATESGLLGVTVKLFNSAGTLVASALTDSVGNYQFGNLVPGDYSIQVLAPAGYAISGRDLGGNDALDSDFDPSTGKTITTTLVSGENDLTWDAGLYQMPNASLGDRVWEDLNGNGIQDSGEPGIAGVAIKLLNAAGNVLANTTTNANGNYLFSNLSPGDYAVQVVSPAGFVATGKDTGGNDAVDSDIDAATGKTALTALVAGENDLAWDAGFVKKASIGDKVWSDCDGDGVQDATEHGVAGVVVKLLNAAGTVVASATTDANGNYLFSNLMPGDYAIKVVAPSGTTFAVRDAGGNDTLDSDADTVTGQTALTSLISGENDLTWDVGLRGARVEATFDFNGSSASDGLDGNVRGYTANGISVNASAFSRDKSTGAWSKAWLGTYGGGLGVTDSSEGDGAANDKHTIDNTGRDNYVLFEFSKTVTLDKAYLGYVIGDSDMKIWIGNVTDAFTSHRDLNDALLNSLGFSEVNSTTATTARWADVNAGGAEGNLLVVSAATGQSNDFFKLQQLLVSASTCVPTGATTGSVGDRVWEDLNANGIQDAGENGVMGVAVKLLDSTGAVVANTTTDASGNYRFSNLLPGSFKVQVVKPAGYFFTGANIGGNDTLDSDVDATGTTATINLLAGQNDLTQDAGMYRKASIGDRVWEDANHNNLQDAGESGIAGVAVKLQNSAGTTVATTSTNTSGNYTFSNLDPGSYRVVFDKSATVYKGVDMSTWFWSVKDVGGNDNVDADAYSTGDVATTAYTTLVSGETDLSWDAGITPIAIDLNGNGIETVARSEAGGTFDMLGTGKAIATGWLAATDAFIAVDNNGDGRINGLSELFGGTRKGDGFANLARYDSNGDGVVDRLDTSFGDLLLWQDRNGNHQSDDGELFSLGQAVASLSLGFVDLPAVDAQGNLHLERSSATLLGGQAVEMSDVYFSVSKLDALDAGVELPDLAALLSNDGELDGLFGEGPSDCVIGAEAGAMRGIVDGAELAQLASLYDDQQTALLVA